MSNLGEAVNLEEVDLLGDVVTLNVVDELKVIDLLALEQYRNQCALEFFNKRWDETTDVFLFRDNWVHLDGAGVIVHWPHIDSVALWSIPHGKVFRSITNKQRRLMIVGTRLGPIVIYVSKHDRQGDVIYQYPSDAVLAAGFMAVPKILDVFAIRHTIGSGPSARWKVSNVGEKIEAVYNHFTNPERHPLRNLGHE